VPDNLTVREILDRHLGPEADPLERNRLKAYLPAGQNRSTTKREGPDSQDPASLDGSDSCVSAGAENEGTGDEGSTVRVFMKQTGGSAAQDRYWLTGVHSLFINIFIASTLTDYSVVGGFNSKNDVLLPICLSVLL